MTSALPVNISDYAAFNCLGWYCRHCNAGVKKKFSSFQDCKGMKKHLTDVHRFNLNDIPNTEEDLNRIKSNGRNVPYELKTGPRMLMGIKCGKCELLFSSRKKFNNNKKHQCHPKNSHWDVQFKETTCGRCISLEDIQTWERKWQQTHNEVRTVANASTVATLPIQDYTTTTIEVNAQSTHAINDSAQETTRNQEKRHCQLEPRRLSEIKKKFVPHFVLPTMVPSRLEKSRKVISNTIRDLTVEDIEEWLPLFHQLINHYAQNDDSGFSDRINKLLVFRELPLFPEQDKERIELEKFKLLIYHYSGDTIMGSLDTIRPRTLLFQLGLLTEKESEQVRFGTSLYPDKLTFFPDLFELMVHEETLTRNDQILSMLSFAWQFDSNYLAEMKQSIVQIMEEDTSVDKRTSFVIAHFLFKLYTEPTNGPSARLTIMQEYCLSLCFEKRNQGLYVVKDHRKLYKSLYLVTRCLRESVLGVACSMQDDYNWVGNVQEMIKEQARPSPFEVFIVEIMNYIDLKLARSNLLHHDEVQQQVTEEGHELEEPQEFGQSEGDIAPGTETGCHATGSVDEMEKDNAKEVRPDSSTAEVISEVRTFHCDPRLGAFGQPILLFPEDIASLKIRNGDGKKGAHLTVGLVDYLVSVALKGTELQKQDVIIATSSLYGMFLHSDEDPGPWKAYDDRKYRLLVPICFCDHYVLLDVVFDFSAKDSSEYFKSVQIYDSDLPKAEANIVNGPCRQRPIASDMDTDLDEDDFSEGDTDDDIVSNRDTEDPEPPKGNNMPIRAKTKKNSKEKKSKPGTKIAKNFKQATKTTTKRKVDCRKSIGSPKSDKKTRGGRLRDTPDPTENGDTLEENNAVSDNEDDEDQYDVKELLKVIQKGLALTAVSKETVRRELLDTPDLILKNWEYKASPQQERPDCALFSIGALLHLWHKEPIDSNSYTQKDITEMRQRLYKRLKNKETRDSLNASHIHHFFPDLRRYNSKLWNWNKI